MKNKSLEDKTVLMITALFGVGYTPVLPGTAACVAAVAVFLLIKSQSLFFIITFISVIFSFALSGRAETLYGRKDCKKIVIDDFSGMLITFLFFSPQMDFIFIISGFFLFRMLDLLKIPPADRIEKFEGAKGVVGDDLVAGIYANLILHIVKYLS